MYGHTDLRKGVAIQIEGTPYQVLESSNIAMARGGGVMRTKIKNLVTGAISEKSFRANDKITPADLSKTNMQYLYADETALYFMNPDTFDQEAIDRKLVGDGLNYLIEGSTAIILYFDDKPIGIDIGNNVFLKVTETAAGAKGDTATAALKPAVVETGLEVMVPLFINQGDVIKVDTRDGKYLERQK